MRTSKTVFFWAAGAVALAAGVGLLSIGRNVVYGGPDDDGMLAYTWVMPPGSPDPAWYVVEVRTDGSEIERHDRVEQPRLEVGVKFFRDYEVRVAAVAANGRQGPFSAWTTPRTFEEFPPTNESGTAGG